MVARAASEAEASTSGQNSSAGGSANWGPTPASANGADGTPTLVCQRLHSEADKPAACSDKK